MPTRSTELPVMQYVQNHPNVIITPADIVKANPTLANTSVSGALNRLVDRNTLHGLEKVAFGAYRYTRPGTVPPTPAAPVLPPISVPIRIVNPDPVPVVDTPDPEALCLEIVHNLGKGQWLAAGSDDRMYIATLKVIR